MSTAKEKLLQKVNSGEIDSKAAFISIVDYLNEAEVDDFAYDAYSISSDEDEDEDEDVDDEYDEDDVATWKCMKDGVEVCRAYTEFDAKEFVRLSIASDKTDSTYTYAYDA